MVSRRPRDDDERAVSNVVGYVLLVGIVAVGLVVATLAGGSVVTELNDANAAESASVAMSQTDSRLSALSADKATGTTLSFEPGNGEQYTIVREGEISIHVNGGTCSASVPLSSVRYDGRDGGQLAYEAGGVWRRQGGGSVMVSPPEVSVRNGTVDMTVVNVSGTIDSRRTDFRKLTQLSRSESLALEDQLLDGTPDCRRPTSLTIEVTSDFYRAWGDYLADESGLDVDIYEANDTARLHLDQADLPTRIDDSRNQVVDLSDSSTVTVDRSQGQITVDKRASNEYTAFARPLANGLQVSHVSTFESDIAFRQAIDVVFVMDESGSMNFEADGDADSDWCNGSGTRYDGDPNPDDSCTSKMDVAKGATKQFVGRLNSTYDRVGVVGFANPDQTRYVVTSDGRYITDDFGDAGANGSVTNLVTGGGTHSATGIRKANALFDLKSDSSRKKVMVLLSDGQDDGDADDPVDEAKVAAQNDVTIHTVGLGAADQDKLSAIAEQTGGTYHYVDDASGLNAVFDEVFAEIAETDVVVNEPATLQSNVAGTPVDAQVGDNPDYVALADGRYNVNDPAASPFSVSLSPDDGALVEMQATQYECNRYRATDLVVENETTGEQYREIRCVDIDESSGTQLSASNVSVYIDGDDAGPLLAESAPWWEGDLRDDTLAPYLTPGDDFDLESNQAVVVFDFGSSEGVKKRLIMLYEIGISTNTRASDVVNVNVVSVTTE